MYLLISATNVVIFQGYQVFTRSKSWWTGREASWKATLVPWMTIVVMCLLSIGWYIHNRIRTSRWSWEIPIARKVDLNNGAAPEVTEETFVRKSRISKVVSWVLNNI
jgi:hypothetical protein